MCWGSTRSICQTGDTLAQEQTTRGQQRTMCWGALGESATKLREKLGESLEDVCTSLRLPNRTGHHRLRWKRSRPIRWDATPCWRRAIITGWRCRCFSAQFSSTRTWPSLTRQLGTTYHNLGEKELAAENNAPGVRATRESERTGEVLYRVTLLPHVSGDLDKAKQVYELWAQTYPRESVALTNMGPCCIRPWGSTKKSAGKNFRASQRLRAK